MYAIEHAFENNAVAVPWMLGPEDEDLDLEIHGCGCGCDGGCGCGCGCSCSCSCSCDDTGANGDDSDDSSASDESDAGGAEDSATSPVISGCIPVAAGSSLGFDPVAELTGEHYDPSKDEDFITTGARGLGDMMSPPVNVPAMTATVGSALGDADCRSTIVDAFDTVIDGVTDFASEAGRQFEEADRAIQNAVGSIRDSLRN